MPVKNGMPEINGHAIPSGLTVVAIMRSASCDFSTASAIEQVVMLYAPAKPLSFRRSLTFAATAVDVAIPDPHAKMMCFMHPLSWTYTIMVLDYTTNLRIYGVQICSYTIEFAA